MGKRGKVHGKPGHYVERSRDGKFKKWTAIPRSIARDAVKKCRPKLKKPGYGHQGDYKTRK